MAKKHKSKKTAKTSNKTGNRTGRGKGMSSGTAGSLGSAGFSSKHGKIMPLGDRVIVRPMLASETESKNNFGIIIPDTVSKERPEQGTIVAVGDGRTEDGKLVPLKVRVGDKVVFSKYGFDEVQVDGSELYILKEENILAVIR